MLRLVVEGGDGPDRASALVDGKEPAGVLLHDLVVQEGVDPGVLVGGLDDEGAVGVPDEDKRADRGRLRNAPLKCSALKHGRVVVDVEDVDVDGAAVPLAGHVGGLDGEVVEALPFKVQVRPPRHDDPGAGVDREGGVLVAAHDVVTDGGSAPGGELDDGPPPGQVLVHLCGVVRPGEGGSGVVAHRQHHVHRHGRRPGRNRPVVRRPHDQHELSLHEHVKPPGDADDAQLGVDLERVTDVAGGDGVHEAAVLSLVVVDGQHLHHLCPHRGRLVELGLDQRREELGRVVVVVVHQDGQPHKVGPGGSLVPGGHDEDVLVCPLPVDPLLDGDGPVRRVHLEEVERRGILGGVEPVEYPTPALPLGGLHLENLGTDRGALQDPHLVLGLGERGPLLADSDHGHVD